MFAFIGMPGPMEMFVILIIAVLLFGSRLPKVMKGLGEGITEFKKGIKGIEEPIEDLKKEKREIEKEINS
jgi:sec-independent protein translocase protein TatA